MAGTKSLEFKGRLGLWIRACNVAECLFKSETQNPKSLAVWGRASGVK